MKVAFGMPHLLELKTMMQEIIDRLNRFREAGITMSAVPVPPVSDVDEYLDYAQWIMKEIKPNV